MQVHQVERDATLKVTLDPVDRNLLADVQDLAVADAWLGQSLIDALVLLDTLAEIAFGFFA